MGEERWHRGGMWTSTLALGLLRSLRLRRPGGRLLHASLLNSRRERQGRSGSEGREIKCRREIAVEIDSSERVFEKIVTSACPHWGAQDSVPDV